MDKENEINDQEKQTFLDKVFEILKIIVGIVFIGGIFYLYNQHESNKKSEPLSELDFYKAQSIALNKHIALRDSIELILVSENRSIRKSYDSLRALTNNNSPKKLPIFK